MSLSEFAKLTIGCIGLGGIIMLLRIFIGALYNIENPAYVEYSGDNKEQASVYVYGSTGSRRNGYVKYNFIRKGGNWKTNGEFKSFGNILIAALVLFIMETIVLVIADAEISAVLPALLIVILLVSVVCAVPLANIILACNALDDDLRGKRNKNK